MLHFKLHNLSVVMPGFMPGTHVFTLPFCIKVVDCRDISAYTRVFDALCPAMTTDRLNR
jgi:hypothetical protein